MRDRERRPENERKREREKMRYEVGLGFFIFKQGSDGSGGYPIKKRNIHYPPENPNFEKILIHIHPNMWSGRPVS